MSSQNKLNVSGIDLKVGQVIKNYKELCKILNVKPTGGKGKKYHIREFERYCAYTKEGHKFIIDEVYDNPLPKKDGRVNNGRYVKKMTYYPQYHVDYIFNHFIGVYKITQDRNIYIGSTIDGFRSRFIQHVNLKSNQEIYNMLQNGGKYEVIWSCEKGEFSEKYIRDKENKYIEMYRNSNDWKIINVNDAWCFTVENEDSHKKKKGFTAIRVEKEYYDEIIELLDEYGYTYKSFHNRSIN